MKDLKAKITENDDFIEIRIYKKGAARLVTRTDGTPLFAKQIVVDIDSGLANCEAHKSLHEGNLIY